MCTMAVSHSPIPGMSANVLLAMAARRVYSAALAVGKSKDTVPALGPLEPLAKQALELTAEEKQAFTGTLNTVSYLFDLDRYAADLLHLSLALELDERLYMAALNLTGTLLGSPGPRVGGWLAMLFPHLEDRTKALATLINDAPLIRYRLVRLLGNENAPASQRELCGEPSLIAHFMAEPAPGLPTPLIGLAELVEPPGGPVATHNGVPQELGSLINLLLLEEVPMNALHVHPLRRRDAVPLGRRIASNQGRPVIVLDLRTVESDMDEPVAVTLREARLRHGLPLFLNPMSTGDEEPSPRVLERVAQRWRRVLASEKDLVIFATDSLDEDDAAKLERVGLSMADYTIEKTTLHRRRELFAGALERSCEQNGRGGVARVSIADDVSPDSLAAVYRVDEGDIHAIVNHAALQSQLRAMEDDEATEIRAEDLWAAGRDQTKRDISKFAHLVRSRYSWDDLVLPDNVKHQLMDFFRAAKTRAHVFEDWGYAKKHVRGLGLCAMFSGESGTGKTMSAEVIANMLNVNMYRIDLSAVVSKWVGETERNLAEIFQATEHSDSIVFFDEADSLFGKRTEVSDSKDRYANIEVSYLLQRIETYDGIVILSTNLRSNIDQAFLRRIQYGINFEMPNAACRAVIWAKVFPEEVPLGKGVDFEVLAERYTDLSGGQIRMIAVGASMLAAGYESDVTLEVIHRSFIHEMHKVQRLVEDEFQVDTLPPSNPLAGPSSIALRDEPW